MSDPFLSDIEFKNKKTLVCTTLKVFEFFSKQFIVGVALGMTVSIATSYTTNFYLWFLTYSFLFGVANNMVYNTGMQMCNAFFP